MTFTVLINYAHIVLLSSAHMSPYLKPCRDHFYTAMISEFGAVSKAQTFRLGLATEPLHLCSLLSLAHPTSATRNESPPAHAAYEQFTSPKHDCRSPACRLQAECDCLSYQKESPAVTCPTSILRLGGVGV